MTTPIRIGINGWGRIGRCVVRALMASQRDDILLEGINSRCDSKMAAHLLQYDSTHGIFTQAVESEEHALKIGQKKVHYSRKHTPHESSWKEWNVDLVMECSGAFNDVDKIYGHLEAGASKVLVAAPSKIAEATIVYGVNDSILNSNMKIISNASCTTNCLAPVAKVLHQNFGIESGLMNTIHAQTLDQKILDASHQDCRRGRAAGASMIPTKTGAAKAIGLVLPDLEGKISGLAVRVPTINVSLVDFSVYLENKVSVDDINDAMCKAAGEKGELNGILAVNKLPLVSVDFNGRPESSIFDTDQTLVANNGHLVKVMAWYDNEWGFANRMLDVAVAAMRAPAP